jgi:predicted acylesterase/phospholipase RssA
MSNLHALVHSGGGSNGAWGVGVLQHLFGNLGVQPAFVVGTSVGGLNGGLLCQFAVGEEAAAFVHMLDVWGTVQPDLIYKQWWPSGTIGDMRGVACKHSVYNDDGLHTFIENNLPLDKLRGSGRPLYVSLVDLATGDLIYADQDHPEILAAVQGTAAYPFFFSPVRFEGKLVSDGGLREITPLQKAVELGATFIDVICCQPEVAGPFDPEGKVTLELGPRYLALQSTEINKNDLAWRPEGGPEITVRLWQPPSGLGSGLDFSQDKVQRLIQQGYDYANPLDEEGTRTWVLGGPCATAGEV